jgi:SGNH hydrolase-like domain, acetyltransferase AlgX
MPLREPDRGAPARRRECRFGSAAALAVGVFGACHPGAARFPWGPGGGRVPAENVDVRTLNDGYDRTRSGVLVREVERPTRAALDYAAYHANFMIADLAPEAGSPPGSPDTSNPFRGLVEKATLTGDVRKTPLREAERRHPLAFAPAVEFLHSQRVASAAALADVGGAVRAEGWGLSHAPEATTQSLVDMFLHDEGPGSPTEIWVKIEFVPWFAAFRDLPDQDGDGFPEIYGRVKAEIASAAAPAVDVLRHEYAEHLLTPAEVKKWANQLSSYWYPSFNTDLAEAGPAWPDDHTEADVKRELGGHVFAAPTIVLRGKPQGRATYDVFLVKPADCGGDAPCGRGTGGAGAVSPASATAGPPTAKLPKSTPTPEPQATASAVTRELAEVGGGSWTKWAARVAPLHDAIRARLRSSPPTVKAFAGADGFLFYRNGLEYVVGGDLENQRKGKNPFPVIVEFKKELDAHDVDFLFVPVPTKEEVFPDAIDARLKALAGQIVDPFSRKLASSLAQAGVEVVDLLPAFLATRSGDGGADQEPIFQHQDTHWTDRGLRLAADLIGARIKKYPWYDGLRKLPSATPGLTSRETWFTRFGDLHSRLPEVEKKDFQPEKLVAHQVFTAFGSPYEDDPDSPIVVLGDSFTGVYELTDAEHAGVSAHIAKEIGYPVDLVMSYGGGPNVREKLLRRGPAALGSKKLVVWIMTARDLYNYWDDWAPLGKK